MDLENATIIKVMFAQDYGQYESRPTFLTLVHLDTMLSVCCRTLNISVFTHLQEDSWGHFCGQSEGQYSQAADSSMNLLLIL